jgi:hypothetical protein
MTGVKKLPQTPSISVGKQPKSTGKTPNQMVRIMQDAYQATPVATRSKGKTAVQIVEKEPNFSWTSEMSQQFPTDQLTCPKCKEVLDEIKPIKELYFGKPTGARVVYSQKKDDCYNTVEVTWTPSFIRNRDYCQKGVCEPPLIDHAAFKRRFSEITLEEIKSLKEFKVVVSDARNVSCSIYFCDFCRKASFRTRKTCETHIRTCKAKREEQAHCSKVVQELYIKLNGNKQKVRKVKFAKEKLKKNKKNAIDLSTPAKYSRERLAEVAACDDEALNVSETTAGTSAITSSSLPASDSTHYRNVDLDMKFTWDDSGMTIRQKLEHYIAQAQEEQGQNDESD